MIIKCKIDGEGFELHFSEAKEVTIFSPDPSEQPVVYLSWTHALCGQEYRFLKKPPIIIKDVKDPIIIKDTAIPSASAQLDPDPVPVDSQPIT